MRGAVFTARFPASLIVFSASGLTLMLRPAPVRPFFALACPVWADAVSYTHLDVYKRQRSLYWLALIYSLEKQFR